MRFFKKVGVGVAVAAASVGSAFAELPADVTAALTEAKTDGVAVAATVLGVIIAISAFKYIRKAL